MGMGGDATGRVGFMGPRADITMLEQFLSYYCDTQDGCDECMRAALDSQSALGIN